jgi:hypothetical protein
MKNIIKNLLVKVIEQLKETNEHISYFQVVHTELTNTVMEITTISVRTSSPGVNLIMYSPLINLLADISRNDVKPLVFSISKDELKFCFMFEDTTPKMIEDINYLVTDLNEIIRSYYNTDHILSRSAVELLELGNV